MKVSINCKEWEFQEGTRFTEVVKAVRNMKKDDPLVQAIRRKSGREHILFVLNGRVVKPQQYDTLEIKPGDDIRYVLPFAGG
ncbi:MAG: MoaD/ThiS family protein [Desulfobacterales bacterium]|nr:MAG: MoaD/ThiS family protein [Desulfobacterales bacterium]